MIILLGDITNQLQNQIEHINEDKFKIIALLIQSLSVFGVALVTVFSPIIAKRFEQQVNQSNNRQQQWRVALENNRHRRYILEKVVIESEKTLFVLINTLEVMQDCEEKIDLVQPAIKEIFENLKNSIQEINLLKRELETHLNSFD